MVRNRQTRAIQLTSLPEFAIEADGLGKSYAPSRRQGAHRALDDVTLRIPRGSFFGLLGPNGAGKSTFINILAGLVTKTDGTAKIWGHDIEADMRDARRAIGIVPQELNIDPFFTPREMLDLQAGMYGVPKAYRRTDEILDAIGLTDKADAYARTLSGGMRRRLLVGKAMVHSPQVLVLDEPTAGVDIELRRQLWDYVRELNQQGTTVLLTTHYLEEAEELCDTIAIINHGKLITCEPTKDLLKQLDAKTLTVTVDRDLETVPAPLAACCSAELNGPRDLIFHYPPSRVTSGKILAAVADAGLTVVEVGTQETELEDIFLSLTRSDDAEVAARAT